MQGVDEGGRRRLDVADASHGAELVDEATRLAGVENHAAVRRRDGFDPVREKGERQVAPRSLEEGPVAVPGVVDQHSLASHLRRRFEMLADGARRRPLVEEVVHPTESAAERTLQVEPHRNGIIDRARQSVAVDTDDQCVACCEHET